MDYKHAGITAKKIMELLNVWMALPFLLLSCNEQKAGPGNNVVVNKPVDINPYKQIQAIPLPAGFERLKTDSVSFTAYLRNIGLKEQTTVYLFNGATKA